MLSLRAARPVFRTFVAAAVDDGARAATVSLRTVPASLKRLSSTTTTGATLCPTCSTPLPTPLPACPACRQHISRAPSNLSKHAIFGLSDARNPFVVDIKDLRHRFREVQRVVHPDAWSGNEKVSSFHIPNYNTLGSYPQILARYCSSALGACKWRVQNTLEPDETRGIHS
jgi:hypothetical protein